MIAKSQKTIAETNEFELPHGIRLDENGKIIGALSAEEWMHRLGNRLISHYGDIIRPMLNESLVNHGINPIRM